MTERDEMEALATRLDAWADPVSSGYEVPAAAQAMREAANALRSAARTGPDVANSDLRVALKNLVALVSTDRNYDDSESLRDARYILFAANKEAITALPAPAGESVTGWQPIETAPRDETILAWGDNWHWSRIEMAFFHSNYNGHFDVVCREGRAGPPFRIGNGNAPTHWQPLPPAPTITRKSEARS